MREKSGMGNGQTYGQMMREKYIQYLSDYSVLLVWDTIYHKARNKW